MSADLHTLVAPFSGIVVSLPREVAAPVRAGTPVAVIEAMKMEHEVLAEHDGVVAGVAVAVGDAVTFVANRNINYTNAPTPSPDATSRAAAPPARTSPTCSIPAASSSTARSCSPPRSAAAPPGS